MIGSGDEKSRRSRVRNIATRRTRPPSCMYVRGVRWSFAAGSPANKLRPSAVDHVSASSSTTPPTTAKFLPHHQTALSLLMDVTNTPPSHWIFHLIFSRQFCTLVHFTHQYSLNLLIHNIKARLQSNVLKSYKMCGHQTSPKEILFQPYIKLHLKHFSTDYWSESAVDVTQ